MHRKYYEAYDDRYCQIHGSNLQWFHDNPSDIVMDTINAYSISKDQRILEIGCGEGRDAYPLLLQGFNLLATDVSSEAIRYCRNKWKDYGERFQVLDCVADTIDCKFDFIFSVAVVHMLVLDEDRNAFYGFIRNHLEPTGIGLICTMGDGCTERQTDINTAFTLQNRIHEQTGREVRIAGTSCRMVSFQTFRQELERNGLAIIEQGYTSVEPDFPQMMFAVVKRL